MLKWKPIHGGDGGDDVIAWACATCSSMLGASIGTSLGFLNLKTFFMTDILKRTYCPGPDIYLAKAFR